MSENIIGKTCEYMLFFDNEKRRSTVKTVETLVNRVTGHEVAFLTMENGDFITMGQVDLKPFPVVAVC